MSDAADKAVGQHLVTDEASADRRVTDSGIVELADDELDRVVGGAGAAI